MELDLSAIHPMWHGMIRTCARGNLGILMRHIEKCTLETEKWFREEQQRKAWAEELATRGLKRQL